MADITDELLGLSLEANMVLVGCAVERGLLPFGLDALHRAIELNDAAVEANRRAVALGRLLVAMPEEIERLRSGVEKREEPTLGALIEDRVAFLTSYQNRGLARRYLDFVSNVRRVDAADELERQRLFLARSPAATSSCWPTRTSMRWHACTPTARSHVSWATSYGVAALRSSSRRRCCSQRTRTPGGSARSRFLRASPCLRCGALAKLKFLRGTALDPFGHTEHRRRERGLISWYEALVTEILSDLSRVDYETAVELAGLPQDIQGFRLVEGCLDRGCVGTRGRAPRPAAGWQV